MVPHRRLKREVERAERWLEEATVVPSGDHDRPSTLELDSEDLHDITEATPLPTVRPGMYDGAEPETRVDMTSSDDVEIEIVDDDGPRQFGHESTRIDTSMPARAKKLRDDATVLDQPKKQPKKKDATLPAGPTAKKRVEATPTEIEPSRKDDFDHDPPTRAHVIPKKDRGDKTLVRRLVDSVVAAIPNAIRRAASGPIIVDEEKKHSTHIDARSWREVRTAPIFDGLPNEALRDALLSDDMRVHRLERDALVALDGMVGLVRVGQVALGLFDEEVLKEERKAQASREPGEKGTKKERKRRQQVGPMIELAQKNLAYFEEGDVVEAATTADQHRQIACYAVTPVAVVTIARTRLDLWKRIYPFMADRFRRAANAARAKLDATDGAKAAVADFFIRNGLSVSMTLRVRKLDSCIECGACEQACEDRYGAKRLSLHYATPNLGKLGVGVTDASILAGTAGSEAARLALGSSSLRILGGLDFVDACHTCTDQRCVDPCNFDAISYDAERREVLINEANCTGCTLCALACPYDAIDMHDLDDKPMLKLRLDKEGKLAFGEGAPRKAKLRKMASKCDHCAYYQDQACITACPTGALVEILPSDVVQQLPDQVRQIAKAGFDRTAMIEVGHLNTTKAFTKGLDIPELGRARAPRVKLMVGMWWFIGVLAVLGFATEIALRKLWPAASVAYFWATRIDGLDPDMALHRVDYRPGCELAVNLGYVGTAIMISGMAYVWRRRFAFARNWGSLRAWFDWHVLSGVIGPLFILMHSAAKLDNWVSIAFWSMVLTVVSGLLGRFLTTQLEDSASTAAVETLDLSRALEELRRLHVGVRAADAWYEHYRTRVQKFERRFKNGVPTFFGGVVTLFWVSWDDTLRGQRLRELKRALKIAVRGHNARAVRGKALKYVNKLAVLERRRVTLPRLEPLFRHWKAVHVPMAVSLTIIASIHIFLALRAG